LVYLSLQCLQVGCDPRVNRSSCTGQALQWHSCIPNSFHRRRIRFIHCAAFLLTRACPVTLQSKFHAWSRRFLFIDSHVFGPFTVEPRVKHDEPSGSRRPHIQLRLTNGVCCPGENLRCTSSTARHCLPLSPVVDSERNSLLMHLSHVQEAIDIAQESFTELKDVERYRIRLEVRVMLSNQPGKRTAEIGRSAWSAVVYTLARFEIVEIRVAPPPMDTAASSSSTSAVVEPPPYPSDASWQSDMKESQMAVVQSSSRIPRSSSSRPPSLASRISGLFIPKSS
jgi:hypothetical protein